MTEIIIMSDCEKCGEEFEYKSRYEKDVTLCEKCFVDSLSDLECNGTTRRLCSNLECRKCYLKSFASHERSIYWSEENKLTQREVFKSSGKKFKFNCTCGHEFESSLANINNDRWCPFCSNQKLCQNVECKSCFEKSFSSHERSIYWSEENKLTQREVFKSSGKKFKFNCICGHEFESSLNSINKGTWCPICKNKTEKLIYEFLLLNYNSVMHQYKPDWCKNTKTGRYLPFDIFIQSLNIIVEVDGRQHFEFVERFQNNVQTNIDRDIYKSSLALQNNISVIRIVQKDVWNNIIDWKKILVNEIEKLKNISNPVVSYISSDSEIYRTHINTIDINCEINDEEDTNEDTNENK